MIKPKSFRKLPECETCLFYTANLMSPCPIHPRGAKGESCLDYRDDPSAEQHWQQFLGLEMPNEQAFSESETEDD